MCNFDSRYLGKKIIKEVKSGHIHFNQAGAGNQQCKDK